MGERLTKVDQAVETLAELISEGCANGGRRHTALRDLVGEIARLKRGSMPRDEAQLEVCERVLRRSIQLIAGDPR